MNRFSKDKSVMTLMKEWQKANPWPSHLFNGRNVIGKCELPSKEDLMKRNRALADPRCDPKFKDIGTSHPSNSKKFRS